MSHNIGIKRCSSYCSASTFNLTKLAQFFTTHEEYQVKANKDVVHLIAKTKQFEVFFFIHGCFVSWGLHKNKEQELLEQTLPFAHEILATVEHDLFYYNTASTTNIDNDEQLQADLINLENDNSLLKLAFSYAIAQSTKLETFEAALQESINLNSHLPKHMATHGSISLSRRAIVKRMGKIFLTRSLINLNSEYLDTPDFFWRHPNFEPIFIKTKKFLDIPNRVMALNQKLDVLQELLDILNSQIQQSHSNLLESIIILLIVIEIVISIVKWH